MSNQLVIFLKEWEKVGFPSDAIAKWKKCNPLVQMDNIVCSIVLRIGNRILEHPCTSVVYFMITLWEPSNEKMGIIFLSYEDLNICNKKVCITGLLCALISRFSKFTP